MKAIFIGNKKLYERFAGPPTNGFVKVTTRSGTPIMYMPSIPHSQLWVVDVQAQIEVLGQEFGYVSIDDYLEAL
jgi:hypothetical protein